MCRRIRFENCSAANRNLLAACSGNFAKPKLISASARCCWISTCRKKVGPRRKKFVRRLLALEVTAKQITESHKEFMISLLDVLFRRFVEAIARERNKSP